MIFLPLFPPLSTLPLSPTDVVKCNLAASSKGNGGCRQLQEHRGKALLLLRDCPNNESNAGFGVWNWQRPVTLAHTLTTCSKGVA